MSSTTIQWFGFEHLSKELQKIAQPVADLASLMEVKLADGPEKSAGMRKLLEAKDCFVRAAIAGTPVEAAPVTAETPAPVKGGGHSPPLQAVKGAKK